MLWRSASVMRRASGGRSTSGGWRRCRPRRSRPRGRPARRWCAQRPHHARARRSPCGRGDDAEVNRLLDDVARRGVSPRTVNRHRQLVCAIFSYGCREATFGLPHNPAHADDRRPEPERACLDFYSPEEVEALARALAAGLHRDPNAPAVGDEETGARAAEDRQDAELVRVAAYAGLRRGELVALRWHDVDFLRRKLVVRRAVSGSVEATSTKSRRAREVPLPDQAAGALDRLSQRDVRLLLVAGGIDLASVKAAMGHSRITTTERYLHARSASELADRFTRALTGTPETPAGERIA